MPGEGLQLAGAECGADRVTLDLSAGGLVDSAAADQDNGIEGEAVLFEHRGADRVDDRSQIGAPVADDLVHEDKALRTVFLESEGCAKAGGKQRVALARRRFDVLWVMIEPANDDEVVDPAGDVELLVVHEA